MDDGHAERLSPDAGEKGTKMENATHDKDCICSRCEDEREGSDAGATEGLMPVVQRRLVLLGPEESTARARAAFVAARKRDNGESYHPVSLAKDWTGRGFKEGHVDRHWQNFLEGWNAAMKQNDPLQP